MRHFNSNEPWMSVLKENIKIQNLANIYSTLSGSKVWKY